MARVYNFSAGPSTLPQVVLEKAASEMLDYQGTGTSVMEMSHRSVVYSEIINGAESLLRKIMNIPEEYHILFLQGGASSQFAMVPLNLMMEKKTADFIHTGQWSKKAIAEAKRYGEARIVASSDDTTFTYIPDLDDVTFNPDAAYVHITTNNTIYGTRYKKLPETGNVPLVADMSSNILSEVMDVSRFGIIYAGAQKNIGPAGLTIVIIREDLIGNADPAMPVMFDYKTHADNDSMYNTPPTYSWYLAGLVFARGLKLGGMSAVEEVNKRKAEKLYKAIDDSAFYSNPVDVSCRSWMNVPFILANADLDAAFFDQGLAAGGTRIAGRGEAKL